MKQGDHTRLLEILLQALEDWGQDLAEQARWAMEVRAPSGESSDEHCWEEKAQAGQALAQKARSAMDNSNWSFKDDTQGYRNACQLPDGTELVVKRVSHPLQEYLQIVIRPRYATRITLPPGYWIRGNTSSEQAMVGYAHRVAPWIGSALSQLSKG